jgi:threonine dehydratase
VGLDADDPRAPVSARRDCDTNRSMTPAMIPDGLTRDAVLAAAERLGDQVRVTPALHFEELDALAGCELWLKCENMQFVGAFKARGAMHASMRLSSEARARGLITYSSGNHAQAVALAARRFAVPAFIAMPEDAPRVKVDAVRALGARIEFAGTTSTERRARALELRQETGATIIEPFDHADIITGQGTATLEFMREVKARTGGGLDALVVPVGGGGLIAGACLATLGSDTEVHSAEPVGCDALAQSLARGERVAVQPGPTIADGLKPTMIGELNFAIARERVVAAHTVDDQAIGRALVSLLLRGHMLVEPSGAAALAVVLSGLLADSLAGSAAATPAGRPRRVGVLLSGGNIAPELVATLLERHAAEIAPPSL